MAMRCQIRRKNRPPRGGAKEGESDVSKKFDCRERTLNFQGRRPRKGTANPRGPTLGKAGGAIKQRESKKGGQLVAYLKTPTVNAGVDAATCMLGKSAKVQSKTCAGTQKETRKRDERGRLRGLPECPRRINKKLSKGRRIIPPRTRGAKRPVDREISGGGRERRLSRD